MRRRLALAILLSVWVMLLIGGVAGYVGVRTLLFQELDALLYARACALPELNSTGNYDPARIPLYDWRDQYTLRRDQGAAPTASTGKAVSVPRLVQSRSRTDADGVRWRTVSVAAVAPRFEGESDVPVIVEYSGSSQRIDHILHRLVLYLAGFGFVVALAAAGVAMWVSSIVLRPLKSTAELLQRVDEENLAGRLSPEGLAPELLPVSDGVNDMLSRLQRAFEGHRRFVANISHELATPVTTLASLLDGAERKSRTERQDAELVKRCHAEVKRLGTLVARLAECSPVAPADAEAYRALDVVKLVDDCADEAAGVAALKKVTVRRSGPTSLCCTLPPQRVRSILTNLLSYAVELGSPGAEIEVGFFHDGTRLHLRVGSDAPSFTVERLPHLFTSPENLNDPSPDSAARPGLGLFIVQSHVKALGGSCRVEGSGSGQASALVIDLPCAVVLPEGLMSTISSP